MNKSLIILILFFILFISCNKSENSNNKFVINLPQTLTPLEFNQWGVTKYASLKLRTAPFEEADVINHLPLGAIVEIIKKDKELKNFENISDHWYYIDYKSENGWIFGSYLEIYNGYEEAEKKSEEILFGNKN